MQIWDATIDNKRGIRDKPMIVLAFVRPGEPGDLFLRTKIQIPGEILVDRNIKGTADEKLQGGV